MGNSWQQPVSGEPSLGTMHYIDQTDNTIAVYSATPNADTWTDADFSSFVPAGTKAVMARWRVTWVSDGNCRFFIRKNGGSAADGPSVCFQISDGGTDIDASGAWGIFPLDANGVAEFKQHNTGSNNRVVAIYAPMFYWL